MISNSRFFFFFFNDTATTEIYTLSLHDALPIYLIVVAGDVFHSVRPTNPAILFLFQQLHRLRAGLADTRSEEHTSELQSQSNLVCRLLLEKKKDCNITSLLNSYLFLSPTNSLVS